MVERILCRVPVAMSNSVRKALEGDGWFCSGIDAPKDAVVCTRGERVFEWKVRR